MLGRHGFGEIVERSGLARFLRRSEADELGPKAEALPFATRLRLVLQDLGPSFVKLGQIMSTRPDVLPPEIILELKKLQDRVPPVDFAELRAEVEHELGAPIGEVYASFDETPMASASIAQVHRAQLKTGGEVAEVVVKIQRPNIKATVERDVDLLYLLARTIERGIPESRIYSPAGLVAEFDRAMSSELDFTQEADHAERFARAFAGMPSARFPGVYREASARKVLTLEFLPGQKVHDAVSRGFSGEKLAKLGLQVLFKQIFEDGFFHADPHPGNILILGTPEEPVFGLIDLGLVGRLSPELRDKTVDLMVAAVRQDARGVADALYAIGVPTRRIDRRQYDAEVTRLAEKYLGKPIGQIEVSALLRDIVQGAIKYGLEIPPEFLMLGRTLMTIEGVGKEIYPELDVFTEAKPMFMKALWQRYSPERLGNEAIRALSRLGTAAGAAPEKLDAIMDEILRGNLVVKARDPSLPAATELLGRRVWSGLVVASLIAGGSLVLAARVAPEIGYAMLGVAAAWIAVHTARAWMAGRAIRRE